MLINDGVVFCKKLKRFVLYFPDCYNADDEDCVHCMEDVNG